MRDLFLLDPNIVFLNHGSFGACPAEVLAVLHAWQFEMERNPVEFLGRRSANLLAESRACLAEYLGAQPDHLVYITNATTGVNTVARSLNLQPGDEILTTDHEYGACDAAWERVCLKTSAQYARVTIPLPFDAATFVDRVVAGIKERTRVIYLSHITSTTAFIFPIEDVCQIARQRGILTLIDGAHAPGHTPLALDSLGADFYTGNCHKWLCAPKGTAFLYARPEHHAILDGLVVSWGYCAEIESHAGFDGYTGSTLLERHHQWQGTRDISPFLTVPAAIDFQKRYDWDSVRLRCHELAIETRDRIDAKTGLVPICGDNDFGQMVAIAVPDCDPEVLRAILFNRYRIEVPITTQHGQHLVRPAFQAYNTWRDADALLQAFGEIFG